MALSLLAPCRQQHSANGAGAPGCVTTCRNMTWRDYTFMRNGAALYLLDFLAVCGAVAYAIRYCGRRVWLRHPFNTVDSFHN